MTNQINSRIVSKINRGQKTMSKKKKIVIFIIIFSTLLVCTVFLLNIASYSFVKARAVNYLCDKYDADKDEFELVDYLHSGFHEEPDGEWVDFINWHDFSFEFKYKNKSFFVNRYNGKFYDDYQIYDIEKWCTEWLQENVDENIVFVGLDSETLIKYYTENGKINNKEIIIQNNIKSFIEKCILIPESNFSAYVYYDKNETINNNSTAYKKVELEMKSVFNKLDEVPLASSSRKNVKVDRIKSENGIWKTYYF